MGDINSTTAPKTTPTVTDANAPATATAVTWQDLSEAYNHLQQTAYTTQGVKTSEVTALQSQFNAYISANVQDPANQKDMLAAMTTDLGAMAKATDEKESSGKTSNEVWDATRQDLESLLKELAPEGGDAIWTPGQAIPAQAPTGNTLLATPKAQTDGTDGSDITPQNKATSGTQDAAAGSFGGVPMISLSDMVKKFPELAPYQDLFAQMGAKYNVPAQLLAAQAMQESHANPSEPGGGMMQFSNGQTWRTYGDASIDPSNFNDSNVSAQIEGAANYDATLLSNHGGDLTQALLEYSGGLDFYPNGIKKWMSGMDGYTG